MHIHTEVKWVPPYPEDSDSLRNVKFWPKARVFDGVTYVLEYLALAVDVFVHPRSLSEIDSAWSYGAHYATYSANGQRSKRGPSYWWRNDGSLSDRHYQTPTWEGTWSYDRKGRLYMYEIFDRGPNGDRHIRVQEYFAEDGPLVGCVIMPAEKWYWMAVETRREWYERKVREFYRDRF